MIGNSTGLYRFYDAGQGMTMFCCYAPDGTPGQCRLVSNDEAAREREALIHMGYRRYEEIFPQHMQPRVL